MTEVVTPGLDLFLEYGRVAEDLDGRDISTPALDGVSGATAWTIQPPSSDRTVWSPEGLVKIAGIQASFLHSQFIRIKSWSAVAILFGNIDEQLAEAIQDAIGIRS